MNRGFSGLWARIRAEHSLIALTALFLALQGVANTSGAAPAGDSGPLALTIRPAATGGTTLSWTAQPEVQGYLVQYRDRLSGGAWTACPPVNQWPQTGTNWTDPTPFTNSSRFYRVVALPASTPVRGQVLSAEVVKTMSTNDLNQLFTSNGLPVQAGNGIVVYRLLYATIDPHGLPTTASGALILPQGLSKPPPLLSYQHGTSLLKTDAPSAANAGEYWIGLGWGATGYATAMPDYLGLGQSPGLHPYTHAHSEATAVVDMLRASRMACATAQVALNHQLFLVGYSQGGQATMAAHREIEAYYASEFQITASAPMAGPYDMSGTMVQVMLANQPYDSPDYLPYTLFAFNDVYGLYTAPGQVLAPPYDTVLPPLFDGAHSGSQIDAVMPSVPSQIFRPDYLLDFQNDSRNPLRTALEDNDLYDWTPRAPMTLYHCKGDTTVPFANSQIAFTHFQANGAKQVQLVDPNPAANHVLGGLYSLLAGKQWFDSLKQ